MLSMDPQELSSSRWESGRHLPYPPANGAMRLMRVDRHRYDLIYQQARASADFHAYSVEWWVQLAEHANSEGLIVVELPLSRFSSEAVRCIAHTFQVAMQYPCYGRVILDSGPPVLRMTACFRVQVEAEVSSAWGQPLDRLWSESENLSIHSVRQDRITPALRQWEAGEETLVWVQRVLASSR